MLASAVSALGITPGQRIINFEPNTEHTIQFNLLNDQHKDLMLMVYTLGELNASIELPMQLVVMPSDESSRGLSYTVKLPSTLPPGDHSTEVVFQEINPAQQQQGVGVETQLAVATRLIVRVPYPDKYLEIGRIEVMKPKSDGTIEFRLPIQNLGQEVIEKAKAELIITDPEGKEVGKLKTQEVHLDPRERILLTAVWDADVEPGEYSVIANVKYDDMYKTSEETIFDLGEVDIEIVSIETKNFHLGQVAKVDITMLSRWNKMIEDAYVTLDIKDPDGNKLADVKTPTFNLLPYMKKTEPAYWDTSGHEVGQYHITLEVHFYDKIITKYVVAELSLDQISFGFLDATGKVVSPTAKIDKTMILSVIVVLLIVVNVMWFVYVRRRRGKYDTVGVSLGRSKIRKRHVTRHYERPAVDTSLLLDNIKKAKEKKKELVHKVEMFKKQYEEEKLTYSEYEYKMNHYLRGKDIEYWKKYYNDYIKDATEHLKEQKRMRPPSGP